MSPDEILWAAPDRGGLTSVEWEIEVDHLTRQLATFLNRDIERSSEAFISPGKSFGFSVKFWSVNPIAQPIDFHVRGRFGASDHKGTKSAYIGVQGWLYPYVAGQRTATTDLAIITSTYATPRLTQPTTIGRCSVVPVLALGVRSVGHLTRTASLKASTSGIEYCTDLQQADRIYNGSPVQLPPAK